LNLHDQPPGNASAPLEPRRIAVEPWWALYGEMPAEQLAYQAHLRVSAAVKLDGRVYVAEDAHVIADELHVGDGSFIATGALVRGHVHIGSASSVNAYAVLIGRIAIGDDVRIASHASIIGFNHNHDDPHSPMWTQGVTERGVTIEDDVWIGANAVIVDGVTVGSHSIVAAGAVVTRNVAPWSIVAGNPARIVRDRRLGRVGPTLEPLSRFSERAAEEWRDMVLRCQTERGFVDHIEAEPSRRATCDAIEIAAAFGDIDAVEASRPFADELRSWQDPPSGLIRDIDTTEIPLGLAGFADPLRAYNLIAVDGALRCLGARLSHPIRTILQVTSDELVDALHDQPWHHGAWIAGNWVDCVATAVACNARDFGQPKHLETLFGWLLVTVDPANGVWGQHTPTDGWLNPVNGFYRLTRGTFAQFGVQLPYPERAIDTVLAHGREYQWFQNRARNACNVLDITHPLWLAGQECDYRRDEIRDVAATILRDAIDEWTPGQGMRFQRHDPPGLHGTEMWLSIIYLAATVLGEADGLPWQPRGVHRLAPTFVLSPAGIEATSIPPSLVT
jgi:acetyltransferase-like isoleucine patch superfamily enzyme